MSTASMDEALKNYDRKAARAKIESAETEREQIVSRFPLSRWKDLPLSAYALGQGNRQESFCWWLEFNSPHIGSIRGGAARKHSIYKQTNGEWWFNRRQFRTVEEAWERVRAGFCHVFEKGKQGAWDQITELQELGLAPALTMKTLYCYFPDDLLPINSIDHLMHFLKLIGQTEVKWDSSEIVRLNRLLLSELRKQKEISSWTNREIASFLYWWSHPKEAKRVIKISPGKNAEFWDECLKGEYICVGWDEVGDLDTFDSKESAQEKFNAVYGSKNSKLSRTEFKELWTLTRIEVGDLIVANDGNSRILAVGEVVEPGYQWRADRTTHRHTVRVKWDTSFARQIPKQNAWNLLSVANVSQSLAAEILSANTGGSISAATIPDDPQLLEIAEALERKGQAILYGPPGTGKTYNARRFAVWWLLKDSGGLTSDCLRDKKAFEQAERQLTSGQVVPRVWWLVANPKNWSWDKLFKTKRELFSYGRLSKNYPLVRKGDLVVGYQSTPDKKIVALARISREMFTDEDDDTWIEVEAVAKIDSGLTFDELKNDHVMKDCEPMHFNNQGTLFSLTETEFEHLTTLLVERDPELRKLLESENAVSQLTRLTFHPSYCYEDFIEGFRPIETADGKLSLKLEHGVFKRVCRAAQANPKKKYLVLIDEINRANVPKVFGEIITLLEQDKRKLSISLPQSKEPFVVPPNVFILGTMNTADRSIKLLDAALRRRFAFIELMPNLEPLEGAKVGTLSLAEFLENLNQQIIRREGREKQIGQSFLLQDGEPITEPDEFARRFRHEILPLLQEYCFEDYSVLASYIGSELVDHEAQMLVDDKLNDADLLITALEKTLG